MKKLWVLVVLSAFALGCTPAPQPPTGGGDAGNNSTATSNTTAE